MISKSQIKLITSLGQKKYRDKSGLFVAEGPKVIIELTKSGMELSHLFTTVEVDESDTNSTRISEDQLKKISFLKTPNSELALFKIKDNYKTAEKGLTVVLDSVRDPGNLGTIIRLCDWYGVQDLVCSMDSVDCYNPKVVQATMGSIARVNICYLDIEKYLEISSRKVYGGCMNGEVVYDTGLSKDSILVLGNEANGISSSVLKLLDNRITVPQFGDSKETESLNVATAAAILINEFMRSTGR